MTTVIRTYLHRALSMSVAGLGLAVTLALLPGTSPATATAAGARVAAATATATPADVKTQVAHADRSVTQAIRRIRAHEYARARTALEEAVVRIRRANVQAASLIGAPPTDPESDDPPGPPAVLAALGLDNRVSIRVVPLFDGMGRPRLLDALRTTIRVAQHRRVTVLDQVLALPAEGDGDDYADGMADTLPSYAREVSSISHALDAFSLTPTGRSALTAALAQARQAKARMNSAYGGGERASA